MTRQLRLARATLLSFATVFAGAGHPVAKTAALDDVRHVRELRAAILSPDGRRAALVVTASSAEGGQDHLWLSGIRLPRLRQLTSGSDPGSAGERDPSWSADGASLYFRAGGDSSAVLRRLVIAGGTVQQLTLLDGGNGRRLTATWGPSIASATAVSRYALSPDGKRLALAVERPAPEGGTRRLASLYLIQVANGAVRSIDLPGAPQALSWSRDGRHLAVVEQVRPVASASSTGVWRVDADLGAAILLPGIRTTVTHAVWTGDNLAYLARCDDFAPPECLELFAYDTKDAHSTGLTRGLRGSLIDSMVVSADERSVILPVTTGLAQRLARIVLRDGTLHRFDATPRFVSAINATSDGRHWLLTTSNFSDPRSLLLTAPNGHVRGRLAIPRLVPIDWPTAAPRRLSWIHAGLRIDGLLYLPPSPQAGRVPLVVWVHGGPYGAFQDRYYALVNLLVSQGWAVLMTNPRGSFGYGAAFAAAVRDDLGGRDFRDIMIGVDTAIASFPIDAERMALIGYSYGGTMAAFTAGRTRRFKALVAGAPVADQFSEYGTEDDPSDDQWYFGNPWQHRSAAWRQSPISRIGSATTPMLIVQGSADRIDPPTQAEELRRALAEQGVDVSLKLYPRETHSSLAQEFGAGPSREPSHGLDLMLLMARFLHARLDR